MADKQKLINITMVFLLICTVSLVGCDLLGRRTKMTPLTDETEQITDQEMEKAVLLKKVEKKFDNPKAHYELGKLYQTAGDWAKAEDSYKTALRFNPVHRKAQVGIVKVAAAAGDKARAKILAEGYIKQASESAMGSLKLAMSFRDEGFDNYAIRCYNQALELAPDSPTVNKYVGYYYLSINEKAQAKKYLIRSFELDAFQPGVAAELGRLGVEIKVQSPKKSLLPSF